MCPPLGSVDDGLADHLRGKKQCHHPRPAQQMPLQVVPQRHKGEHNPDVQQAPLLATQRDVEVPDDPLVEGGMPVPPEASDIIVVAHTSA